MMLFLICPCQGILNRRSRICLQPKDTQQALSRKESAVNMEKFKKFAARRKWKVNLRFIEMKTTSCTRLIVSQSSDWPHIS